MMTDAEKCLEAIMKFLEDIEKGNIERDSKDLARCISSDLLIYQSLRKEEQKEISNGFSFRIRWDSNGI